MKQAQWILLATLLVAVTAPAEELRSRKIWRSAAKSLPEATLRCRVANDAERFTSSVRQAQWQDPNIPKIQWPKELAVIVAPQFYLQDHRMKVTSIDQTPDKIVVTWALVPGKPDVVVETKTDSYVTTHSSTAIGPEILIVALSRDQTGDRKVVCRGPQLRSTP